MLLDSILNGLQLRRPPRRANRGHAGRRAGFETFEDRCMLSLTTPVDYPVGAVPGAAVTADFNNDGRDDVAVAVGNSVSVLLGNANGTLQPALTSPTGVYPQSLAVGDLDGDGILDLVAAGGGYGDDANVSVLLGNDNGSGAGTGSFGDPTLLGIGLSPNLFAGSVAVAVGDFNGDGKLDLGVSSTSYYDYYHGPYYGNVTVLLGHGDGHSFSEPNITFLDEYGAWWASAAVADFDGDNIDDFATVGLTNAVRVLYGDGSGYLQGRRDFSVYGLGPMAADDLDGDGDQDLVMANSFIDNNIDVLLGDGSGGFAAAKSYFAVSEHPSVAIGDFTGDGELDIATANWTSNDLSILRGIGDGTFSDPENFAAGSGVFSLAAGDFNGDGWLDVVAANYNANTVSVLLNDQAWPSEPPPLVSISDATVTEGDTGAVNATFTLTLSKVAAVDVTVQYATEDWSASAGSDYTAAPGAVTIPAGETSATIAVAVLGDRIFEPTEFFAVNLSAPTNASIRDGQGFGMILDNDPPINIRINDVAATEGNGKSPKLFTFTVSLSATHGEAVTVYYATANGTATAGSDYQSKTASVTFAPGETTKTITVAVMGDKQKESDETFFVDLTGASVGEITDSQGVGTILNDDRGGSKGRPNSSALAFDAAIDEWMFTGRKKRAR